MNLLWDLDPIYTGVDSPEYKSDYAKMEKVLKELDVKSQGTLEGMDNPAVLLDEILHTYSDVYGTIEQLLLYPELKVSANTNDVDSLQASERAHDMLPMFMKIEVQLGKMLAAYPDAQKLIGQADQEYSFYLKELLTKEKYALDTEQEVLYARLKNTGSIAWENMKNNITSNLMVDIVLNKEEKKLPLASVRNLAYDPDQQVRKTAYEAELKSYDQIAAPVAAALNAIKGEVITGAEVRGYKDPLEMTLVHSRMDRETLDALLDAIVRHLPMFQQYLGKKAEMLGYSGGLPFYELFAPLGAKMEFTYEEARTYVAENFDEFSKDMGDFARRAFDNRWIDVEPHQGKVGGAFCAGAAKIEESRILTNFEGSFDGVSTLAHELGHGFHNYCMVGKPFLVRDYPMPLAETASIFCETLITESALKGAKKEERLAILESYISGTTQTIVDIYSRYLFETWVFEERKNGSLSVKRLRELMIKAQKTSYGEGLDDQYLHSDMWINKPHYYHADSNFYNFPYAFGTLFSTGLYTVYKEKGEAFVPEYKALLAACGSADVYNVAKQAGIDLHKEEFWNGAFAAIKEKIDAFMEF